jgi:uncharacterized protein YbaR (Trm112 family)
MVCGSIAFSRLDVLVCPADRGACWLRVAAGQSAGLAARGVSGQHDGLICPELSGQRNFG